MKRRILILIIAAAMLSAAAIGTLAYFTTAKTAVNVITSGSVSMLLHDELPDGTVFPADGLHDLMPGDTAGKVVYVENVGNNAFYTRVRLDNIMLSAQGSELDADKIQLDIDDTNWALGSDGWYYYLSPVEKDGETTPLFTQVTFSPEMGNGYMNAEVRIEIVAQAVQQANNGATVWQAAGWPAA